LAAHFLSSSDTQAGFWMLVGAKRQSRLIKHPEPATKYDTQAGFWMLVGGNGNPASSSIQNQQPN